MIPCQRQLFDIPENVAYLNTAYMGPLLKSSAQIAARSVDSKLSPWNITPKDFFAATDQARTLFGQIVDAPGDHVAIVPSVSYGIGIAAANLKLEAGQSVMVLEDQFPSNVYPWQIKTKQNDAKLITVARPGDWDWTAAILDTIDSNTAIVALPHCHWTDGSMINLVAIGQKCREVNAALVVDATQSNAVMPFSVKDIQPDFLVSGCYKWMLGPYGYGFMYVDSKWHNGRPLEENWINRHGSEDFSRLVDYQSRYQPGALRYDYGEKSSFFQAAATVDALEHLLDWGAQEISDTIGQMTGYLADAASDLGFQPVPLEFRAPHLLGLRFANGIPGDLPTKLAESKVYVSVRGDSVRVAPHVYTNQNDLDRLIGALKDVV